MRLHRVVALVATEVVAFDLATPAQVFGREPDLYAWAVCAPVPGAVPTENGFDIVVSHGLEALAQADTVIVPGISDDGTWPLPAVALDALRAAAERGARVASICTGAFVLAAAGLLDGRRATTHWRYASLLAREFPRVTVDPGVLYVDEGDVLTSAGVVAGVDLCLHMVRRDRGAEAANAIARRMVVAAHRDGGQAQYVERPLPVGGSGLAGTRAWMEERLAEPLTVDAMARHAGYSPRSFARRFRAETGTTPLQWLIMRRVAEAQRLLEGSDCAVEEVAARCGFGAAVALRQHFGRVVGTSPTSYRRTFRGAAA
jgi:transcriptional regulator GlxA family with amidase domain